MRYRLATIPTLLIVVALDLSACDPIYGVSDRASLASIPPLDCVEETMRATPGVQNVGYWTTSGSRPLTLTGIQAPDEVYNFSFSGADGSHVGGFANLVLHYDGTAELSLYLIRMHEPPPQADIDATFPIIKAIEAELETHCAISALREKIHETCSGVRCGQT